jgi:hypothetical protein
MRLVIVESPFAGRGQDAEEKARDHAENVAYAERLCRAIALRGDAPYASHLLLTRFLDDTKPDERAIGIESGLAWGKCAALTMVGVDRGASYGIRLGVERAIAEGRPVVYVTEYPTTTFHGVSQVMWDLMQLTAQTEVLSLADGQESRG